MQAVLKNLAGATTQRVTKRGTDNRSHARKYGIPCIWLGIYTHVITATIADYYYCLHKRNIITDEAIINYIVHVIKHMTAKLTNTH